jgi:hypothetical protein
MKKFFYFRDQAAAGDDDDSSASVMVPIDDITGIVSRNATQVNVYFNSQQNVAVDEDGETIIADFAALTITQDRNKFVTKALVEAMNNGPHHEGITVIADDQLSTYLVPDITACTLTMASAVK